MSTESVVVGWHHSLNEHEFEQTPGESEGQGSLVHSCLWGCRVTRDLATKQQQNYVTTEKATERPFLALVL